MTLTVRQPAASMRLDYDTFLRGLGKLTENYPPRGQSPERGDALLALWWDVLLGEPPLGVERDQAAEHTYRPWLTTDVFEQALRWCAEHVTDYLPTVGKFLQVCGDLQPPDRSFLELPSPEERKRHGPIPAMRALMREFAKRQGLTPRQGAEQWPWAYRDDAGNPEGLEEAAEA